MVQQGVRFITVGESSLTAYGNSSEEAKWLQQYQEYAKNHSVYLALGYALLPDPDVDPYHNRVTIIDTDGNIVVKYDKNHGVPFTEATIIAGTGGPAYFELDPKQIR